MNDVQGNHFGASLRFGKTSGIQEKSSAAAIFCAVAPQPFCFDQENQHHI